MKPDFHRWLGDHKNRCFQYSSPHFLHPSCSSHLPHLAGLACPFFIKQAVDTLTLNSASSAGLAAPLLPLPWLPSLTATPAVQGALLAVACFGLCDMIKVWEGGHGQV